MVINKNEVDKYIFDPNNPKQCKSYELLLMLAKKIDIKSFFSPEFLQYFLRKQIISNKLEESLWDKPNNYEELSVYDKLKVFKKNFSELELKRILYNSNINISKELHFSFLKKIAYIEESFDYDDATTSLILKDDINIEMFLTVILSSYSDYPDIDEYDLHINEYLFASDKDIDNINIKSFDYDEDKDYSQYIFFSKGIFNILEFPFMYSSIFITLEKNINIFLKYKQNNIKPIFLKRIEDVDILLNVLEQDLKKQKTIPQEKISTIEKLSIKNFFSIKKKIELNLKDKKEIYIVGENGDGKTLLLQAIAIALKGTQEDGLKAFREKEKDFNLEIDNQEFCQNNFFAYGSSRNNACQMKEDKAGYLTLFSGEYDLKSPTKWLQYLDYSEQKENSNIISVEDAKKLLQHLLNSDIEIEISPNGVTFKEKGAEVSFEQLSAGYRGVITIICDLIARLSEKQEVENIAEFQGIVLIDEVELHLHPKWQYGFMNKLRETFPLIQFIVTTHSSTVLLGASEEATFYKIYKEDGDTKISQPIESIKNLMANALNTSPLFDMTTARARNSDDNFDTSDDYLYTKIHEKIAQKVQGKKSIISKDIEQMIDEELDNFLKENDL